MPRSSRLGPACQGWFKGAYIKFSATLFSRLAIEVFRIRLRVGAGTVDDAVPMIWRRIERIELQRNTAGIDDVVLGPSRDEYREARFDGRPNTIENRFTGTFFHAKELVELVDFSPDLFPWALTP